MSHATARTGNFWTANFGNMQIDKIDFRIDRAFSVSSEYIPGLQMSVNSADYFSKSKKLIKRLKGYDAVFVNLHRWLGVSNMIEFLSWFPSDWKGLLILGIHMPGTAGYRFDHCLNGENSLEQWLADKMPGGRQDINVDAIYYAYMSEPFIARMETPLTKYSKGTQHNFRRCDTDTRRDSGAWLCCPKCEIQLQLILHKVIQKMEISLNDASFHVDTSKIRSNKKTAVVVCETADEESKNFEGGILHVNATVVNVSNAKFKCS